MPKLNQSLNCLKQQKGGRKKGFQARAYARVHAYGEETEHLVFNIPAVKRRAYIYILVRINTTRVSCYSMYAVKYYCKWSSVPIVSVANKYYLFDALCFTLLNYFALFLDVTYAVDWALKANYLSIYLSSLE